MPLVQNQSHRRTSAPTGGCGDFAPQQRQRVPIGSWVHPSRDRLLLFRVGGKRSICQWMRARKVREEQWRTVAKFFSRAPSYLLPAEPERLLRQAMMLARNMATAASGSAICTGSVCLLVAPPPADPAGTHVSLET